MESAFKRHFAFVQAFHGGMHNNRQMKILMLIILLLNYHNVPAQLAGSFERWQTFFSDGSPFVPIAKVQYNNEWHFESRYNYESDNTISLYTGRIFSGGHKFSYQLTPFAGGQFGKTHGATLGMNIETTYKNLFLDIDSQFTELDQRSNDERDLSFLYCWAEAGTSLSTDVHAGIVYQYIFHPASKDRQFHLGLLAAYNIKEWMVSFYGLCDKQFESNLVCNIRWCWEKSKKVKNKI
jgi:hypothetical protein